MYKCECVSVYIYICTYYPADTEWGQHPRHTTKKLVLSRIEVIRDHRKVPANSIAFPYLVSKWSTWRKKRYFKKGSVPVIFFTFLAGFGHKMWFRVRGLGFQALGSHVGGMSLIIMGFRRPLF